MRSCGILTLNFIKMDAQDFITKKYEHNDWGLYPPSRRLVGEWLEEFAKEYHAEQLRIANVVQQSEQYCECDKPTLGKSVSRCGTCDEWFKPLK